MYVVLVNVDMKPDHAEDMSEELDGLASWAKTLPGLVRATWANNETKGVAFLVFDNEAAAREVAANAGTPDEASVTFNSVDVYEVAREV